MKAELYHSSASSSSYQESGCGDVLLFEELLLEQRHLGLEVQTTVLQTLQPLLTAVVVGGEVICTHHIRPSHLIADPRLLLKYVQDEYEVKSREEWTEEMVVFALGMVQTAKEACEGE